MTPSRIELMRKRRRLGERKGVSESIILVNLFWCLLWSWTYKIDTFWDRRATKAPQFFGWLKTASSNQISIDWFVVVRSNPPFGDKRLVTVLPPLSATHELMKLAKRSALCFHVLWSSLWQMLMFYLHPFFAFLPSKIICMHSITRLTSPSFNLYDSSWGQLQGWARIWVPGCVSA